MPRRVEQFEFTPGDTRRVLGEMARLSSVGSGWINFLPGVDEEAEGELPQPSVFSALFGTRQAPTTMATWVPAKPGSRSPDVATVGIMHPRGRSAVSQLRSLGAPLPDGWRVRQDHARRGLVALVPATVGHDEVLDWLLRAGTVLVTVPLTGSWQARVFQPDGG